MRTQNERVERYKKRKSDDMMGFEVHMYIPYLDYQHAKEFLKPDVIEKEWNKENYIPLTDEGIKKVAVDYLEFAWEKANGCRGISAMRSLQHYQAWLWLLGNNEFDDLDEYEFYGKPQLERICEFLNIDSAQWDDGIRSNDEY